MTTSITVTKSYILSIKKIDVTATGKITIIASVKYKGQYATIEFDAGRWKVRHESGFPIDVILDAKKEIESRIQKIIEKIDEILALCNGLGLTIVFK